MITSRPGGGTELQDLEGRGSEACLDDAQVFQLVDLGQRVQRHYGAPQDTEWALDSGGHLLADAGAADNDAVPLVSDSPAGPAGTDVPRAWHRA